LQGCRRILLLEILFREERGMGQHGDYYIIEEDDLLDRVRRGEKTSSKSTGGPLRSVGGRDATRVDYRSRRKSRAPLASTLSLFICGAGQAYNGQVKLGLLLFLSEVLTVVGHWALIKIWPTLKDLGYILAVSEQEIFLGLAALDFLLIFFLLYNVAQAYHEGENRGGRFQGLGMPLVSGLASLLVPGWGQLLNAQVGKALFFLFCLLGELYAGTLVVLTYFFHLFPQLGLEGLLRERGDVLGLCVFFYTTMIWVLSVYDAYLVARYSSGD
jgi:hypothetical protein